MNTSKLTHVLVRGCCSLPLVLALACAEGVIPTDTGLVDGVGSETGDGDGNRETGDRDLETGDGDGEPGAGDGDPGDGDGEPGDGDGGGAGSADGDPGSVCGNGRLDPGEACDDGNLLDTDACTSACLPAICGDMFVQAGVEDCDDGNLDDTDACAVCQLAICGDSFVHAGVEACDDGNLDDTDGCVGLCQLASCGDSFVQAGVEDCDDGNFDDTDDCTSTCTAAACGDGFVQSGEACDDGNLDGNDGCSAVCEVELPPNPVTLCASPNTQIPSFGPGTASAIHVPVGATVTDVNVSITATHTWVGDLIWTLTKDDTSRVLIDRVLNGGGNCSSDNIGVALDDEFGGQPVQVQCANVPPAIGGNRTPNAALAGFDNLSMVGDWSLQPIDLAVGDGGTFQQWCITITWQ